MRKGEQSKRVKTLAKVLQLMSELLFTILYMTILGEGQASAAAAGVLLQAQWLFFYQLCACRW